MRQQTFRFAIFFIAFHFSLTCVSSAEENSNKNQDLQKVARQFRAPLLMEGLDPTLPAAKAAAADLDRAVATLLATQIADANQPGFGGWDRAMNEKSDEISFNGTYFRRTLRLARAWACPASRYYHDEKVAVALNRALKFALPFLEKHKRPNNWWAWDIGIPQRLGDTLIYAAEALEPDVRRRAIAEQVYLTKRKQLPPKEGANNAWEALVQARTAVVTGDTLYLDYASETMSRLLEEGRAIQPDYSYFFHGPGLNIGYGLSHWEAVSRFVRMTDGTPWSLTPAARDKLIAWTNEFFRHNAWKGMWSPWSLGRSRTRPFGVDDGMPIMRPTTTRDALSIARPLMEMTNIQSWPLARRRELMAMAVEHFDRPTTPSDDPSAYYLLKNAGVQAGPFTTGAKMFPYTDYMTARRPNWYAAVRLNSRRTKTWFTLHGENPLGHEQAEGSLALMTDPSDFAYDVLVTMPYGDLPGVTRQVGLRRIQDSQGEATHTGGIAMGEVGLAGFDYCLSDSNQTLKASKSYLMLPDALVLLGSGITSEGEGAVSTTLALVRKRKEDVAWYLDGAAHPWGNGKTPFSGRHAVRMGDVGVVTLMPMDLEFEIQTIQAGSTRINAKYKTEDTYTNRFGSLRVKHGEHVENRAYAAVLLPAASKEEVTAFATKPSVRVLANRPSTQVIQTDSGLTAAAFFAADRVDGVVAADGPVYFLLQEGDKKDKRQMGRPRLSKLAVTVPAGEAFGRPVTREICLRGHYALADPSGGICDVRFQAGETSLTLSLKSGESVELLERR